MATSSLARLASWFDSAPGRRLLAEQTPFVGECARRFHGDTLLWAGCHTALTDTVRGCMIRHRFLLDAGASPELSEAVDGASGGAAQGLGVPAANVDGAEGADLSRFRAVLDELPLPNRSLDAVVLHHSLETAEDPRRSIREVARVLAPGGRLLIVAFNPWSLWGVRGAYARVFRDSFSGMRFISSRRLQDWLTVLGFELQQEVKYLAYELPFSARNFSEGNRDAGMWQKLRSLFADHRVPVGGVYVISAVKQVAAIRPDWSARSVRTSKLAPAAYPRLSARVAQFPPRRVPERIEDPG